MGIDGVMNKTNKTFVFERERIWSSHFTVIFGYLTMAIALPLKKIPVKSAIMKSTSAPLLSVSK